MNDTRVILAVSGTYVEPYKSPLGQVILIALLAAYVNTLVWMKRMAMTSRWSGLSCLMAS